MSALFWLVLACRSGGFRPSDQEPRADAPPAAEETPTASTPHSVSPPSGLAPDLLPDWVDVAPDRDWHPGDPIPGWEDVECPRLEGPNVLEISWPDEVVTLVSISGTYYENYGFYYQGMRWDCRLREPDCAGMWTDRTRPYVHWTVFGSAANPDSRGQGTYGPNGQDDPGNWRASVEAGTVLGYFAGDGPNTNATNRVCLERVRPDEIRGVVQLTVNRFGAPLDLYAYGELHLQSEFDVHFSDHAAGQEGARGTHSNTAAPYDFDRAYFDYGDFNIPYPSYVYAWPWLQITDPAIRSAVFWRFAPYNDATFYEHPNFIWPFDGPELP